MGARGGPGNPYGGGQGVNTARGGDNGGNYAGGYLGPYPYNPGGGYARMGQLPPSQTPDQAYGDLMRDIGRLRAQVDAGNDKDLAREYQDLVRKAQQMDPRHMTNDAQLGAIVGAQAMNQVDELELVLRKKLAASDGSIRSTNPRVIPPGYADQVAEYTKRLSRQ
jgi:hypothetical protein